MQPEVRTYLEKVRSHLYLRADVEKQLITELNSHLQQKIDDLTSQDCPQEEAVRQAIFSFGEAESVARLLYEACCKGSWADALKFSLPHLLAAVIFASAPFHKVPVLLPVFVLFILVSLAGWLHGKPDWLYSWVGYTLLPLFAGCFLLLPITGRFINALFGSGSFSSWGTLIAAIGYYILSACILLNVSLHAIKRDWLLASLMLAPLPIISCWLYHMQQAGGFFTGADIEQLNQPVAQALIVLAFTAAVFVRLRQRVLKAGVIVTVLMISMMVVGQSLWGNIGFFGALGLSLFSLLVFIIPAVTNAAIGHGEPLLKTP